MKGPPSHCVTIPQGGDLSVIPPAKQRVWVLNKWCVFIYYVILRFVINYNDSFCFILQSQYTASWVSFHGDSYNCLCSLYSSILYKLHTKLYLIYFFQFHFKVSWKVKLSIKYLSALQSCWIVKHYKYKSGYFCMSILIHLTNNVPQTTQLLRLIFS